MLLLQLPYCITNLPIRLQCSAVWGFIENFRTIYQRAWQCSLSWWCSVWWHWLQLWLLEHRPSCYLVSAQSLWNSLASLGINWHLLESIGITWNHLEIVQWPFAPHSSWSIAVSDCQAPLDCGNALECCQLNGFLNRWLWPCGTCILLAPEVSHVISKYKGLNVSFMVSSLHHQIC